MEVYGIGPYILTGCPHCGEIVRSKGKNSDALMEMMVMHFRFQWECRDHLNFEEFFKDYLDWGNPKELKMIMEEDKEDD